MGWFDVRGRGKRHREGIVKSEGKTEKKNKSKRNQAGENVRKGQSERERERRFRIEEYQSTMLFSLTLPPVPLRKTPRTLYCLPGAPKHTHTMKRNSSFAKEDSNARFIDRLLVFSERLDFVC